MKNIFIVLLALTSVSTNAQSILGKWQLMKKSDCISSQLDDPNQSEDMDELMSDMNSLKSRTPDVIEFKTKMRGEQSTSLLGKRKDYNEKDFLYRFDGKTLHVLDKKSKTITASFTVEEFTASSLILSDASRPCEVRVFTRIM
jgi:hypothetical protein